MEPPHSDNPSVKAKVAAYLLLKNEIQERKDMQEIIKQELEPYLLQADTNARGSYVIPFDEPIKIGDSMYASLQKQKKVSTILNEEKAVRLLKEKLEEAQYKDMRFLTPIVTIEHIDQDALWDLFAQDLLTEEEWDSIQEKKVTWAFAPTKE